MSSTNMSRARPLLEASWRALVRMLREHFTGTAAELAYYGLLSAIPCLALFVGIVGILGTDPETTQAIEQIARKGISNDVATPAREAARGVVQRNGAAGIAIGAGALTTLWVASIYLSAFRRAAYRVHRADPGPSWRARPLQLLLTLGGLVMLAVVVLALSVTEEIMHEIGSLIGAEDLTVTLWSVARWPLTLLVLVVLMAALYNLGPQARRRGRHVLSTGAVAAVVLWLLASVGFEVWVASFADYDATYGSLAGAIAFAIWLWISNLAILFGMVLDLELSPRRGDP